MSSQLSKQRLENDIACAIEDYIGGSRHPDVKQKITDLAETVWETLHGEQEEEDSVETLYADMDQFANEE